MCMLSRSELRKICMTCLYQIDILKQNNLSYDPEEILKENKIKYKKILKNEFSHSLTREKEALKSKADIVCFITQDVVIESDLWLHHLVKNIVNGKCEAAFSRQISKYNNIEKYTREKSRINLNFF